MQMIGNVTGEILARDKNQKQSKNHSDYALARVRWLTVYSQF